MLSSHERLSSLLLCRRLPGSFLGSKSTKRRSVLLILLTCQLAVNCKKYCTQKGEKGKKKPKSWISFKFNYFKGIQYIIASKKKKKKSLNL